MIVAFKRKTYLYLSSELLHLPPRLAVLPPDKFNDGRREGQSEHDVDHAEHHVVRVVRGDAYGRKMSGVKCASCRQNVSIHLP